MGWCVVCEEGCDGVVCGGAEVSQGAVMGWCVGV